MRVTRGNTALVATAVVGMLLPATVATGTYGGTNGRLAFGMLMEDVVPGRMPEIDIHSVQPNGQGLKRLTTAPGFDACPTYSADGRTIYFCSNRTGAFEIWRMDANGNRQRQVTTLGSWSLFPDVSPDGRTLAFMSPAEGDTMHLFLLDLASGRTRTIGSPEHDSAYPVWSPDGRQLAFIEARWEEVAPDEWEPVYSRVAVVDAHDLDATPRVLFDAGIADQVPDWSPNGRQLAFVVDEGLMVMRADGSSPRLILPRPQDGWIFGAAWSPEGDRIAYIRELGGERQLWSVRPDGGDARPVLETPGRWHLVPSWQPLGGAHNPHR